MVRKLLSLLFVFFLIFSIHTTAFPVFASSEYSFPVIVDTAELIKPEDEKRLSAAAFSLCEEYEMDIVILTIDSLDGKNVREYADHFLEANYGEDGILFLLAIEEREWYISTAGKAIYALTDYAVQEIGREVVWYLSEEYYFDGFDAYLTQLDKYLCAYQNGLPIDGISNENGLTSGEKILISVFIGAAVGGISIFAMRSTMNTKRPQRSAEDYLIRDSYRLRTHSDLFLYSNIRKVRRQQNTSRSGGSGGSSVHRSSSGRRHGGGGGKF